jgi:hypothetical protein
MALLAPAGLWLLLLVPPIVLLYFMKLRRPEVRVPASFLWARALRQARSDSFFERLRVNLLLILQIVAVALLALALSRPFTRAAGTVAGHVILVVDRSASMEAGGRFEAARARALQTVGEAPPGTVFMVISATTRARVEIPFTDDRSQVTRALRELGPLDTGTRLAPALRLALSLSRQFGDAEIELFSDQAPGQDDESDPMTGADLAARLRRPFIARPARNVAVSALEARPAGPGFDVLASVTSFADEPLRGYLELHQGARLVDARTVELPARGRHDYIFKIAGGDDVLEARLVLPDDLEVDNHAFTVLPREGETRVLLVSDGNPFLEKALVLLPAVRVFRVAPRDLRTAAGYDLTVWDSVEPPPDLRGSRLVIHPPSPTERPAAFPLSGDPAHPLSRFVDWSSVHVGRVGNTTVPSWGKVIARAGPLPAVFALERGALREVVVDFDLFTSDAPLSPAFPIFLSNAVAWLTGRPLPGSASGTASGRVAAETPIALDFLRAGEPIEVTRPGGRVVTLPNKSVGLTFSDTDRQGVYTFRQGGRKTRIAVDIGDPAESDLSRVGSPPSAAETQASRGAVRDRINEYWGAAVLLALAVLMGEWYVFHQRG